MSSKKHTYKDTLQLIAEILSFESSNESLRKKLDSGTIDWNKFVEISSNQLVLTTCYCRLEQKQLVSSIPDDLTLYIKELTSINRNRNLKIIKEVKIIAAIFSKNNISYSLLKGTAMLVGNYYDDFGERMVGDIDILVSDDQIEDAFNLLKEANYTSLIEFNYNNKNFRHLPRQINPDKIAAVELHKTVLNANYKNLINEKELLLNSLEKDKIRIPNNYFLNLCNILTSQVNGNAYRFKQWYFKNLYDSLALKLTKKSNLPNNKYVDDYLSKFQAIFSHINHTKKAKRYLFRIKHYRFHKFSFKLNFIYHNLENRIWLMIYNKSYRSHVFKNKFLKKR
ncbi:MAG: nucleotidyltransferase family protein [Psychroserpens sp.]|uniref:nucleotidyltransferase family protein n=1 Tax=Psychroserpens sp. TaxID=2020870 RepID=UPI003002A598